VRLTACRTCLFLRPSCDTHSLLAVFHGISKAMRADRLRIGVVFYPLCFYFSCIMYIIRYAPCICVINIGIWEDGRWCQRSGLGTLHAPSLSYDIPRISHSIPYTYPAYLVHFVILQSLYFQKITL